MSTLERLAAARGIRFSASATERRDALRLPLRIPGHLHPVEHRMILQPIRVVLKDISLSGVGILVARSAAKPPDEWVFWTGDQPATSAASLTLVCRTFRVTDAGPSLRLVGGRITAMLAPGQTVITGRLLPGYEWIPTLTETPSDPLAPTPGTAPQTAGPLHPADDPTGSSAAA